MSFIPIPLSKAFQADRGKGPLVGVHLTAMFSSGNVCFARGPVVPTPPVSNQTQQGPATLQGSLLATYCDRIEQFDPGPTIVGTPIPTDTGVQRFSRKKAQMIAFKISAPVILDGSPYIGGIRFEDAATVWTEIKLMPQWNFLTGTTGTLQGEQVTYSLSFVEYP